MHLPTNSNDKQAANGRVVKHPSEWKMHFGYRACLQFHPCPQAVEMAKIELFPPPSASEPEFGLFERRKIKSIQRVMQKILQNSSVESL